MSSLNASLAIALSGLSAEQAAMATTTNNVANINTPGYSREVPVMVSSDPIVIDPLTLGTGVTLKSIESIRDPILESQIQQETQTQGESNALASALSQTQVNFTSTTGDIGTAISNFFSSVNQLSTNPADLSLRQGVLTNAGNLATAFNTAANNLTTQRTNLNGSVDQSVGQINQLTEQIAQLNGKISALENSGQSALTFIDQRTQAIDQLSSLIGVSVIPTDNTLSLTTTKGTALVVGQQSFQLSSVADSLGLQHVFANGNDITQTIVSGQLGGVLQARDQQIPTFQGQLDSLASGLANAVNAVQTNGYDLSGKVDTNGNLVKSTNNLFSGAAAASTLSLAITNPSLIAASVDNTVGSIGNNGNVEAMYALNGANLIQGQNPTEYYSSIVFNVGNATANASAEQSASKLALQQLNDQRSSLSGVSLDEEAANMMRYQQAYSAAAQIVSTINSMMQTVINMKTY